MKRKENYNFCILKRTISDKTYIKLHNSDHRLCGTTDSFNKDHQFFYKGAPVALVLPPGWKFGTDFKTGGCSTKTNG